MLAHRRMVVPAVLAEGLRESDRPSDIVVHFGDGQTESLRLSPAATAVQLLFKGRFRDWFAQTFKPDDELELHISRTPRGVGAIPLQPDQSHDAMSEIVEQLLSISGRCPRTRRRDTRA